MGLPATRDISIYRGDDYEHVIIFRAGGNPLDVSGETFQAQVRASPSRDSGLALATFTVDDSQAAVGIVIISLPKATTGSLPNGHWDLQVDNGTRQVTWLRGAVEVEGDVTHA
jgi:hypothetical protein